MIDNYYLKCTSLLRHEAGTVFFFLILHNNRGDDVLVYMAYSTQNTCLHSCLTMSIKRTVHWKRKLKINDMELFKPFLDVERILIFHIMEIRKSIPLNAADIFITIHFKLFSSGKHIIDHFFVFEIVLVSEFTCLCLCSPNNSIFSAKFPRSFTVLWWVAKIHLVSHQYILCWSYVLKRYVNKNYGI